ncbi:unnamed protein product, partial [marine sediment metagenome]
APITLGRGTREQIRQEVFDAVQILGPGGGLALTPAEAIYASTPWASVEAVIDAWKEVRDYPITAAPTSASVSCEATCPLCSPKGTGEEL